MVIEVEGQSRRLIGTAESQYEDEKILKEINQLENQMPSESMVGVPQRSVMRYLIKLVNNLHEGSLICNRYLLIRL